MREKAEKLLIGLEKYVCAFTWHLLLYERKTYLFQRATAIADWMHALFAVQPFFSLKQHNEVATKLGIMK